MENFIYSIHMKVPRSAFNIMIQLPHQVREAVALIATDPDSREIWLIGSRVNGTFHERSDWDLLVFSSREPRFVDRRFNHEVDIIHVGPSGTFLREGMPDSFTIQFSDLHWASTSSVTASYLGKRLLEFDPGTLRDSEESPFLISSLKAVQLWPLSGLQS